MSIENFILALRSLLFLALISQLFLNDIKCSIVITEHKLFIKVETEDTISCRN